MPYKCVRGSGNPFLVVLTASHDAWWRDAMLREDLRVPQWASLEV